MTLPLSLKDEQGKAQIESMFTEAEYDPKTGELFFSDRGIADCGESGGWNMTAKPSI